MNADAADAEADSRSAGNHHKINAVKVTARVTNSMTQHDVVVATNGAEKPLPIAPKETGRGSSVNGGELLLAALATCVCNDLYREAAKRGISLERVDVAVAAMFPAEGMAARNVEYHVTIAGAADEALLRELVQSTDAVAEIQNTVRAGIPVALTGIAVVSGDSAQRITTDR